MKDGKESGSMGYGSPSEKKVKDLHKSDDCYSGRYDQAPLRYIERQDKIQSKAAGKIRADEYKGRYS